MYTYSREFILNLPQHVYVIYNRHIRRNAKTRMVRRGLTTVPIVVLSARVYSHAAVEVQGRGVEDGVLRRKSTSAAQSKHGGVIFFHTTCRGQRENRKKKPKIGAAHGYLNTS